MVKKIIVLLALGLFAFGGLVYFQPATLRVAAVSAGPDVGGKIAYGRGGAIWLYEGGNQRQLTKGPKDKLDKRDMQPSLSPDGAELVYSRFDEGFSDLYKLQIANPSKTIALTNHRPQVDTGAEGYNTEALWAMQPAWSPDGERIAYTSDVGSEYPGLFSMDTEGNRTRRLESLNHGAQAVEHPSWSPDGSKIAVANYVTGNGIGQIYVLNLALGKWTEITDSKDGAYDPAWSPDGEWIAFTMRHGTAHDVYVVPTDATKWAGDHPTPIQLTTDGASRSPAWSPDGSKLAYLSLKDTSFDLYVGDVKPDSAGQPTLDSVHKLTDKAFIEAQSGLSWGK